MSQVKPGQSETYNSHSDISPLIDCHVHMVGNGNNGSGCFLDCSNPLRRIKAGIMLSEFGLSQSALQENLEELYVSKLLTYLNESSVSHLVLLANERPYDESGQALPNYTGMFVPNEIVLATAERYSQILPGVSIHPARHDALEELKRCLDRGATLLKLLPNVQNVDCSNRRYKVFWEEMARSKLPLLAHTGGELALPETNPAYRDPKLLRLPLECGVTVIGAHCGTNSHYFDTDFTTDFLAMLDQYPNLYGDISGLMTPIRSRHFKRLLDDKVQERLVHGSDVPIPIQPLWLYLRGHCSFADYRVLRQIPNPLERDLRAKRLMGFQEHVFRRTAKLLRWPARHQSPQTSSEPA